jgi:hypothetical protein
MVENDFPQGHFRLRLTRLYEIRVSTTSVPWPHWQKYLPTVGPHHLYGGFTPNIVVV